MCQKIFLTFLQVGYNGKPGQIELTVHLSRIVEIYFLGIITTFATTQIRGI